MSAWSLRTIKARDVRTMKKLLQTLIISQMEYGSVVWSPADQKTINAIESVQKDFTRKISIFQSYNQRAGRITCNTDYTRRLAKLKLYSLERRMERYLIFYMYKYIAGMIPNPGLTHMYDPRRKVYIKPKYCKDAPKWVQDLRNKSMYVRGPLLYNTLPATMRELPDMSKTPEANYHSFKNALDLWLSNIPDRPGMANSILKYKA